MLRSRTKLIALTLAALALPSAASAVCRVVEPPVGGDDPGVEFDPLTTAVYVLAPDQTVEVGCDAGDPAPPARPGDPWTCADGQPADEVRDTLVSMVLQPTVVARGGTAGLIMPVPARPDVHTGPQALVDSARALVDPIVEETVEVREDPTLGYQCSDPHFSALDSFAAAPLLLYGCSSDYYRPGTEMRETERTVYEEGTVESETIQTTDAYDVTVVRADETRALFAWMDDHGLARRAADEVALDHYVGDDAWFVALHVHPDASGARQALAPVVVTWRGDTVPVTHRLQYDPAGGIIQTDAYVIAPHRMRTDDESGLPIHAQEVSLAGTELEGFGLESAWLTQISMTRIASHYIQRDGVLEPDEDRELLSTISRTTRARIAAPCCPDGSAISDPSEYGTRTHERTFRLSESPPVPMEWLGSTPPPAACGGETFGFGTDDEHPHLRGCAVSGRTLSALIGGWGPIALAVFFLFVRQRKLPRR